jgi:hypothetical protein
MVSRRAVVFAILWTAILTVANASWQRRESQLPPAWDQALYLTMSLWYHRALAEEGPLALVHRILEEKTAVAPLFPLSTAPLYAAFGESRVTAERTLALYLFLLVLGTALLAREAGATPVSAAVAVFLLSTYTGVVNFSREYMMDLPAAALATLALGTLLRSGPSALAGLLTGLTLLTKLLSGVFFVGPVLYSLHRNSVRGALLFGAGILATAGLWYGSHLRDIVGYVAEYGFGEGSLPFRWGGDRVLSFSNFAYYFLTIVQQGTRLLPAAALALSLVGFRRETRIPGFLGVWLASGYLLLTLLPNKGGERYVLALLPPIAVIAARSISAISAKAVRTAILAAALLAGALNYIGLTWEGSLTPWTHHHFGTFPHSRPLRAEELRGFRVEDVLASLIKMREQKLASPPDGMRFVLETSSFIDDEFLRAAYRSFLGRDPDRAGLEAYRKEPRETMVESLSSSEEYRTRPLRVQVVPDHRVLNAATLNYLAVRDRLPLSFHHSPSEGIVPDARLEWDAEAAAPTIRALPAPP